MRDVSCYIGLGANLGDRIGTMQHAVGMFMNDVRYQVTSCSGVYETEPWGMKEQPSFLNSVMEVRTDESMNRLLAKCASIEHQLGRIEAPRNHPRVIDLDLLLYGSESVALEEIIVPHPRLHERKFVLVPMCELNPDCIHPVLNRSMRELLSLCADNGRVELTAYHLAIGAAS
jgi:2-amino-4-hydroxy-6-hydroxymethyldihydropteridine diphosphokinase